MPTYKVTDPVSGKSMSLTGDSPPSEQELNDIFAQVGGNDQSQSQPYKPTWLESAGQAIGGAMNKVAPAIDIANRIQDVAVPELSIPRRAMDVAGQGLDYLEGRGAEYLGSKGVNPYVAAGGIKAAELSATMLMPGSKTGIPGKNLIEPTIPLSREAIVSSAERAGMLPTWAQKTGGRVATGIENFIEKTPTGAGPLEERSAFNTVQLADRQKQLTEEIGTTLENKPIGRIAQQGISEGETQTRGIKNNLYGKVPTEVYVPTSQSVAMGDTIAKEESQILPGTHDPEVGRAASILQSLKPSTGEGVTGGPSKFGEVTSVSPETQFQPKPNYFELKRLREWLGGKIKSNQYPNGELNESGRSFLRMKQAVESDINTFANTGQSPLESMVNQEFGQTYKKANAYTKGREAIYKNEDIARLSKADPEEVVNMVFKRDNPTQIDLFRKATSEEGFNAAKQRFTQNILDSDNPSKELGKYKNETLQAIYWEAGELAKLKEYAGLSKLNKSVSNLQGTQGSARSNIHRGSWSGLGAGILGLATGHPIVAAAGIGQFIAPQMAANLYLRAGEGMLSTTVSKGTVSLGRRALISAFITKREQDQ
jgi:hypothetical protein